MHFIFASNVVVISLRIKSILHFTSIRKLFNKNFLDKKFLFSLLSSLSFLSLSIVYYYSFLSQLFILILFFLFFFSQPCIIILFLTFNNRCLTICVPQFRRLTKSKDTNDALGFYVRLICIIARTRESPTNAFFS